MNTEWLSVYPRGGSSSRHIVTLRPAGYRDERCNVYGLIISESYERPLLCGRQLATDRQRSYCPSGTVLVIAPDSVKATLESTDDCGSSESSPETAAEAVIFTSICI